MAWNDVVLIVPGRLFETRLEIKERMTRKSENDIVDTSEFFRDEAVIDFYICRLLANVARQCKWFRLLMSGI